MCYICDPFLARCNTLNFDPILFKFGHKLCNCLIKVSSFISSASGGALDLEFKGPGFDTRSRHLIHIPCSGHSQALLCIFRNVHRSILIAD